MQTTGCKLQRSTTSTIVTIVDYSIVVSASSEE